jgi:hypothetical protein
LRASASAIYSSKPQPGAVYQEKVPLSAFRFPLFSTSVRG